MLPSVEDLACTEPSPQTLQKDVCTYDLCLLIPDSLIDCLSVTMICVLSVMMQHNICFLTKCHLKVMLCVFV